MCSVQICPTRLHLVPQLSSLNFSANKETKEGCAISSAILTTIVIMPFVAFGFTCCLSCNTYWSFGRFTHECIIQNVKNKTVNPDCIVEIWVTRDMIAKLWAWHFSPLAAMQLDGLLLSLKSVVLVQCSCFRLHCFFFPFCSPFIYFKESR